MLVFLYYLVSPFGPDHTYLLITSYLAPAELHFKDGLNTKAFKKAKKQSLQKQKHKALTHNYTFKHNKPADIAK